MSNQETVRQHYVPKTYLNKFALERRPSVFQIFGCNKNNLKSNFPLNTTKVCVKNNMYTLDGETEEERQIIERFYGDVFESYYGRIYELITNDSITSINDSDRRLIIGSVITLLFRTRKLQIIHNKFVEKVIDRAVQMANDLKTDFINIEGNKIKINGRTSKQLASDINKEDIRGQVLIQLELALKLIEVRKNDRIAVIKVEDDWNFITSDNPVTLHNEDTFPIAPFNKDNLLSLPINGKYRIDIIPHDGSEGVNHISRLTKTGILAKGEIAMNNRCQFLSADEFILGSKDDLELLEYQMFDQGFADQVEKAVMASISHLFNGK